jgi:hypothetical protein
MIHSGVALQATKANGLRPRAFFFSNRFEHGDYSPSQASARDPEWGGLASNKSLRTASTGFFHFRPL